MSLRLRDDLPDETGLMGRLPEHVRSRIPIQRVPQPRENRMTASWRQAKPGRIAAALAVSQAQNSGGWFVAGRAPTSGRPSPWQGRSPAARWSSGGTPTGL